ncbi:MAG TPA: DUF6498-containing protein [Kiritimatiellia bacterium]|nr:DUF6498-containing protein [Kiritimatiellia bacterium]
MKPQLKSAGTGHAASFWPDILAFFIGLGSAWWFSWNTDDLVWSLWLSSLVTGYLTVFVVMGAGGYFLYVMVTHPDFERHKRASFIAGAILVACVFLAFFSFHFGLFHLVHASLLAHFFPLNDDVQAALPRVTISPKALVALAWNLLPLYGFFLIASILSDRRRLFLDACTFIGNVRQAVSEPVEVEEAHIEDVPLFKDALIGPYRNVIRMHLLIFVFAVVHYVNSHSFWIFTLVYAVYFFPWHVFLKADRDQIKRG